LYALFEGYLKLKETNMQEKCKDWYPLFNMVVDYCSFNFRYLLKWQKEMLLEIWEINEHTIEVIINKCLLFYFPDPFYDVSEIIEFIMEIRNYDSVFDLFAQEKLHTLNNENSFIEEGILPESFS
jgi:hypothetical protein